jgi:hypothetical protein
MADSETGMKTWWMLEVGRRVVHERRRDGSHIVHINPSGGKSTLVNTILVSLSARPRSGG